MNETRNRAVARRLTNDDPGPVDAKDEHGLVLDAVHGRVPVCDVPDADERGESDLDAVGDGDELEERVGALLGVAAGAADPEVHGDLHGDLEVGEEEVPGGQLAVLHLEEGVVGEADVVLAQVPEPAEDAAVAVIVVARVQREEVDDWRALVSLMAHVVAMAGNWGEQDLRRMDARWIEKKA